MTFARLSLAENLGEEDLRQIGVTLDRSFDLKDFRQTPGGLEISVSDSIAPANLELTLKRIVRARRYADSECLFTREVAGGENADPFPALEARGDVSRLGPGLFAFSGEFLRVRTALDAKIRAMAATQDAVEISYPPLWPLPVLQGIDYFHDFPQLAFLATGVQANYAAREAFAEHLRRDHGRADYACTPENGMAPAHNALAPTVCDCCYWLLRGRRQVADQTFTVHGNVFRNECSPQGGLDRLTAYTMREIVMVGSPAFVLSRRDALVDQVSALVTALDLACEIKSADDPFFCNDAIQKNLMQNLNKLKYEVEVPLAGDRVVAVASINLHNDFFSRNYDYTDGDEHLYSACVAFGYERFTYALFCRHGANLKHWPFEVRAALEID